MNIETIVEKRVKKFEKLVEKDADYGPELQTPMVVAKLKAFLSQALTSAIIEALEVFVPPKEKIQQHTQHEVSYCAGFNECRATLLEKIEALKKV